MNGLKGYFQLIRFELPFAAGICVLMGQLISLGRLPPLLEMSAGFLSMFLLSASILASNDYYDVEADRINAPQRPVPSGAVSLRGALFFSILLLLTGFSLALLLGRGILLFAVMLAVIGYLYNRKFKKTGLPGNLMVSFSVGMTFVYGGASVGMPFDRMAWFFALVVALIDLGEEIAADAMDAAGDRLARSTSLAIRRGRHYALGVSGVIFFSVIALTSVPFILSWFGPVYAVPIAMMDLSIAYSAFRLLKSSDESGRVHIRRLYLGATAGMLLFLLMRMAGC